MNGYQILALLGGVVIVIASLPQLYKSIRTKKTNDVSEYMFVLTFLGQSAWLAYGIHLSDIPIIVSNIMGMSLMAANLYFVIKFKNG